MHYFDMHTVGYKCQGAHLKLGFKFYFKPKNNESFRIMRD